MRRSELAVSVLVLLLISSCAGILSLTPQRIHADTQTTLTLGEVGTPSPTFFQGPNSETFIGSTETEIPYLFAWRLGIDAKLHPGIAHIPFAVPGTNDTHWIVNLLSSDMKWSDGVSINSTDLAYSYGIFLPDGPYANLSTLDTYGAVSGAIKSVAILNQTAVELTTFTARPLFPIVTFIYYIYPWHYYKQFKGDNVLQNQPIFGGPGDSAYIPANYTAGARTFNLVANPLSPSWNGTTPTIQHVTVQIFTDESSLLSALAAGTIDAASISPSDAATVTSTTSLKVANVLSTNQMFVYTRSTGSPFNITSFRQALAYLLDRAKVNSQLYNGSLALGNPIALLPSAISTFWPGPDTPTYNYSTTQAVSLLKASGLSQNGAGNWVLPNGTVLSITIKADNSDPNIVRAAQILQSSMKSVGLQASVSALPAASITNAWSTADFQVMVWHNNYAPTPFRYLRNPANYPGYDNSTFKGLIANYLQDTDPTKALADVKKAELYLANAAVINTVVSLPGFYAYNDQKFTNWQPALTRAPYSETFWLPIYSENLLTTLKPSSVGTSSSNSSSSSTTSTSTSVTTSSSSTTTEGSSTSSATTTTTTSTTTTTTTTTSPSSISSSSTGISTTTTTGAAGIDYTWVAAAAVIIIIIAAAVAYLARRRRPST